MPPLDVQRGSCDLNIFLCATEKKKGAQEWHCIHSGGLSCRHMYPSYQLWWRTAQWFVVARCISPLLWYALRKSICVPSCIYFYCSLLKHISLSAYSSAYIYLQFLQVYMDFIVHYIWKKVCTYLSHSFWTALFTTFQSQLYMYFWFTCKLQKYVLHLF